MLYEFNDKLENFVYWSNCTGDLHHNAEYWIDNVEDLPKELQVAYNELWSDSYWANCYIAEFNGKYGIALEAEYDNYFAEELKVSCKELDNMVKDKAVELANKYSEYDVIFGEDTIKWSNGEVNSAMIIFMPWNVGNEKFLEVQEYFDSMCYNM